MRRRNRRKGNRNIKKNDAEKEIANNADNWRIIKYMRGRRERIGLALDDGFLIFCAWGCQFALSL